jgi:hypothetical protein
MAEQWTLVSPAPEKTRVRAGKILRAAGRHNRLGFFSNNKQNSAEILEAMASAWTAEFGVLARFYKKLNASAPAEEALIAQIAAECDAVLTGSGDCGSCTAATVHDTVALRRKGVPSAMLATESFAGLAQTQARALHDSQMDLIIVAHPIGGLTATDLEQRCAQALTQGRDWAESLFAHSSLCT